MLVPRTPLLVLVGLLILPMAVAGALAPGAAVLALGVSLLLLGVTVVDGLLTLGRASGLSAEFPEVVRLAKNRPGTISFVVRNERSGAPARRLRLGLPFPTEIGQGSAGDADESLAVHLSAGAERMRFEWSCTPLRRGRYLLDRLYFEESSALGLWSVRRSTPIACELRVYPDLYAERRHAPAIFLHRGGIGSHARRQVGRGREFEKLRDYVPGDSIEDISWKATARRQKPISKVFQVERTQEVYVLIDSSRLSARPAPAATKGSKNAADTDADADVYEDGQPTVTSLERCVTSALLLCLAAQKQGDLFGLVTFSDRVRRFLRARNGQGHFNVCRDELYTLEPSIVSPDFEELCAFLRVRLRRRALLIFLTSLDDPVIAESFTRQIELLSRQHLVLVNMLRPPGVRPLFTDPAAVSAADDVYRALGGHLQWQKLRERENILRRQGVHFTLLDREEMTAQLVSQYIDIKQRQAL
jgi:uncharacterized protein (DUF58 family)